MACQPSSLSLEVIPFMASSKILDKKNEHLKNLEGAAGNLTLFKADLLNYDSIVVAIKGCGGVFHVACPVPSSSVSNPQLFIGDRPLTIVDVRDAAEALILAYKKPKAQGRYLCIAHVVKQTEVVEILNKFYPDYTYPKSFTPGDDGDGYNVEKLQGLGWKYRPLEETIVDDMDIYKKLGLLH